MKKISLDTSQMVLLGAASFVAVLAGLALPVLADLLSDSYMRLAAIPVLLLLGGLFVFNRRLLLLAVLLLRASGDIVLESTRVGAAGGASAGLGGAINALIILIALLFFIEKPKLLPRKAAMAWLVFLAIELVSAFVSPATVPAFKSLLSMVSYFSVFVCAFYIVRTPEDFRFIIRLFMASSVIPVIYGLISTAMHASGGLTGFRLQSTFGHANIFAFYLTLVISLSLYMVKSPTFQLSQLKKGLLIGYTGLLFVMLLFTQTRSAWLSCLVLFVLYGLIFERRYLIYIVVLGVLALMVPSVQDRLADLHNGNTVTTYARLNSFAWRVYLWESALSWISPSRYLTGYGIESFGHYASVFFPLAGDVQWGAHNVFVQLFFDSGLIGVLAYLAIFYQSLRVLLRLYAYDRLAAGIMICALVEYLVVCVSDNMLGYLAFNWYFWLFIGMGWALYYFNLSETLGRKSTPSKISGIQHSAKALGK
ncbi:O-antigen ligase family protein [Herbaspirillum sp. RU 5E]|nr:O-antigen ligase family protein [Herbaspirillum sp. RU 5E]